MSHALVPVKQARPAVYFAAKVQRLDAVCIDGGVVRIDIHDGWFAEAMRTWKKRLAAAHPDKGGTVYKFRLTHRAYRQFLFTERLYYARYGMLPPKWSSRLEGLVAERLLNDPIRKRQKLFALRRDQS